MARNPKPPKPRPVTILDVARKLGVSAMTVSRALSGNPHVSDATRRRVAKAAADLGYRPNRWARSLVTRKSGLIGLIVPDISHSFFAEITRGIQEVLEPYAYNLVLCNTNRDPATEIREIEALLSAHVDGLLIASDQPEEGWRYYARMAEQGERFVLIDRYFDQLRSARVGTDDFQAGKLAAEHLIQLGHRAIAHVHGPAIRPARLRLEGYRAALREHKLEDLRIMGGAPATSACSTAARPRASSCACTTAPPPSSPATIPAPSASSADAARPATASRKRLGHRHRQRGRRPASQPVPHHRALGPPGDGTRSRARPAGADRRTTPHSPRPRNLSARAPDPPVYCAAARHRGISYRLIFS